MLLFVPKDQKDTIRWIALAITLITLVLGFVTLLQFDRNNPDLQMVVRVPANLVHNGPLTST